MSRTVYTHGHHDSVLRSHRWRTAENSAGYLLPELSAGMSLLDVGCGPGTITADLAERVAPGRVVALDESAKVLTEAEAVFAERGLSTVETKTGDAYRLPFPDDTFDVVHAHQVLQHLGDPVAALREARRVCRPGGTVAVRDADYAAMCWHRPDPALDDWLVTYRATARANGGEPDAGRKLKSWALAAGFTDISCSASAWCYQTPDERAWWSELWAERTTASAYADRAIATGTATSEDLTRFADAWRRWARHDDAWFGIINSELRCRA